MQTLLIHLTLSTHSLSLDSSHRHRHNYYPRLASFIFRVHFIKYIYSFLRFIYVRCPWLTLLTSCIEVPKPDSLFHIISVRTANTTFTMLIFLLVFVHFPSFTLTPRSRPLIRCRELSFPLKKVTTAEIEPTMVR